MQEFSPKELNLAFGEDNLMTELARRNGFEGSVIELADAPFSREFTNTHRNNLNMLTHNAAELPEKVEELISMNRLYQAIKDSKDSYSGEARQRVYGLYRSQRMLLASHVAARGLAKARNDPGIIGLIA